MENPAKHLVYRPTTMQLLSILTTTVEVMPKESILLLYVSAASGRAGGDLGRSAPFPSTSCLTSEIAPGDLESVAPDNMSDVSVPSMSALTVQVCVRRREEGGQEGGCRGRSGCGGG